MPETVVVGGVPENKEIRACDLRPGDCVVCSLGDVYVVLDEEVNERGERPFVWLSPGCGDDLPVVAWESEINGIRHPIKRITIDLGDS